jgi:hypothetical protein
VSFNTPILFCFFNRPDTALQVFERIAEQQPSKLYLHSDGPRNEAEKETVSALRKTVLDRIDWDCTVQTKFQEQNLGCNQAITGAIDWLFASEETGIVLEDDCLPHPSFFSYCAELLERFKGNENIYHIAGAISKEAEAFLETCPYSYAFSGIMNCWGWATWRRAWQAKDDPQKKIDLKAVLSSRICRLYYQFRFHRMRNTTWDWNYARKVMRLQGICVSPKVNLVANIGLQSSREDKTILVEDWQANQNIGEMAFPMKHPTEIVLDRDLANLLTETKAWLRKHLPRRIWK